MSFSSLAGTKNNYLTSNISWSVTNKPTWVTVTPSSENSSSNLNISVTENTGELRSGTVVIEGGNKTINISITQLGV